MGDHRRTGSAGSAGSYSSLHKELARTLSSSAAPTPPGAGTPHVTYSLSGASSGAVAGAAERGPDSQGEVSSEEVEAYFQATQDRSPNPGNNFQVVIRVRPPLPRELYGEKQFQNMVAMDSAQQLTVSENLAALQSYRSSGQGDRDGVPPPGLYATHQFTFDHVHGPKASQEEVYNHSARGAVMSTLEGYNATIIAYGPTGTGKTYTMEGAEATMMHLNVGDGSAGDTRGIIPRAIDDIFSYIENDTSASRKYLVRASYLQIYNEVISDLLKPERTNLNIREEKRRGIFVEGLSEWVVRSTAEIYGLMQRGANQRAVGSTRLNEISSRSHAVFMIITENVTVEGVEGEAAPTRRSGAAGGQGHVTQSFKVGKLNLVDLAGSERVRLTGATGQRLEESKKINQSLSALGNVIAALTDPRGRRHVPYRDSKLTRILEDSLGGNCKTTMMAMISPALESFMESLSTLKFVNRAKNIKNEPHVNEDLDQKTLLLKYEHELRRLRQELDARSKTLVDKRRLLEVEEQKRRAEEDKLAAITELQNRSQEFMREKGEKLKLEERINSLQSQLLVGGAKPEETPAFRAMLQQEQRRIRHEYEARLRDMERERNTADQDRSQVDRYKQVLLKQRDIMIALTSRLNERDEQILALQEEVEAYDTHQRRLEDDVDAKTAELIALRKAAMEHASATPINPALQRALGFWGTTAAADRQGGVEGTPRGAVEVESSSGTELAALRQSAEATTTRAVEGPLGERVAAYARELGGQQGGKLEAALAAAIQREVAVAHAESAATEAAKFQKMQAEMERLRMSNASNTRAAASSAAGKEAELEAKIATITQQHGDFRREMSQRLDSQNDLIERFEEESARLRQELQQRAAAAEDEAALREQCANHAKERAALKTILESKIRTLVDGIGYSMKELPAEAQQHPRLGREVQALQKLVHATVNAMRTAAVPSNQPTPT